jgi:hypothetical protein
MRILKSVLLSLLVAIVVLVVAVLPAEFGVDPTGLGRWAGLTDLAEPPLAAFRPEDVTLLTDWKQRELQPYESLEYKFRLEKGDSLLFSWYASGDLIHDFHSQPDGADANTAMSFEAGRARQSSGVYLAPFDGEHGWFWENRTAETVTVTLRASGFFDTAVEYRDGVVTEHVIREPIECCKR